MRASITVGALDGVRDVLGEGPTWDQRGQRLIHVDILAGAVHVSWPGGPPRRTLSLGGEVSAAVPRERGGLVVARERQLLLCDDAGAIEGVLAEVEPDRPDNRFNDCRCDPQGRLWAGTMSRSRVPGTAGLYRVDELAIACPIPATTLSNGIGWSPAGDRMYFVDSVEQRIDVLDFDPADGSVSGRRPLARMDPADGMPDGLAVDAEGGVWVCLFGGGALRRYAPDGSQDAEIGLPVSCPTCPAFGGADLTTLYVASARHRLSPAAASREPLAGAVLTLEPGVAGLPAVPFAG